MSELIDNNRKKKELLKHMILQLHKGEAPEAIRGQIGRLMGEVPYEQVVEVEQELIAEGLKVEEVLQFCDIHTAALRGQISHAGAAEAPPGHPVHTFKEENRALKWEIDSIEKLTATASRVDDVLNPQQFRDQVQTRVHNLTDVEKHYQRKENLLFPFLEKHGISGPPKVMWGKHDETRALLKEAVAELGRTQELGSSDAIGLVKTYVEPLAKSISEMIFKEEEILLPMSLTTLSEDEWYQVYSQSLEIGFCLYDPTDEWKPSGTGAAPEVSVGGDRIQLPSGSLSPTELNALLNTIPFDLTFVDADDTVRYFTQGRERIFARNRAILGRKVQLCHPPSSVHIVEQIVSDFKSGKESRAPFWIELNDRFIHIEYFALRDKEGKYLGTLEVSQDLTEKRALEGQQRLLSYADDK
ncbi:MAG: DUF438 domain-containing protein [bacterium]|nr:DUF438 domain-containing protein [bacterium]